MTNSNGYCLLNVKTVKVSCPLCSTAPCYRSGRQRTSVSRGASKGYLDELAVRTKAASPHTSCCPGNKRHDGRPLSSNPLWIRRHKALMAAYAPLPGGRKTACEFTNCHNDSGGSVSVRAMHAGRRRSRLREASVCQQLIVRNDVGRTQ